MSSNLNSNGGTVAIAGLPNSEFVITWVGAGYNVYARRFDNNLTALGNEFQVSMNNTAYAGSSPAIAGFSNGEFVITWFAGGIYAQRFSVNGTSLWTESRLDENTAAVSPSMSPVITALPNQEFVITWGGGPNILSRYDVYARRFASNGTKLGNEIKVNTNALLGLYQVDLSSVIANLANGGFVISWISGTPKANVYAQQFAGDGTKLGTEFQVNNDNTVETVSRPSITSLASNDFVIAWMASDIHQCYAQQIAGNGTMLRAQFPVGSSQNQVGYPNVGRLVNNDYVISWHTDTTVYAQRFSSNSEIIGSNFQVNSVSGYDVAGQIAGLTNGDFVITWGECSSNCVSDLKSNI